MRNRHASVIEQGRWLKRVIQGYFNYHAVPWNLKTLSGFRRRLCLYWLRALRRRSQRHRMSWDKFVKLAKLFIPGIKQMHDYPEKQFKARYSK